jgi:exodeoxyribonuclease VII small subunit
MAKDADRKREPFETLYARLQEHVEQLERGGLSLDESIALYEQGMTLARECQARLEEAELKITKLKESFANVPGRNGSGVRDADDALPDYEYVSDDEESIESDDDIP